MTQEYGSTPFCGQENAGLTLGSGISGENVSLAKKGLYAFFKKVLSIT